MYSHALPAYGSFQNREIVISSPKFPLSVIQSSNKYVLSIINAQGFIRGRHEHDIVLDLVDKQTMGLKRKKIFSANPEQYGRGTQKKLRWIWFFPTKMQQGARNHRARRPPEKASL